MSADIEKPQEPSEKMQERFRRTEQFFCDGEPIALYVVERRFKQDFSVTMDSTFQLPSGLPDIRGIQDAASISPPAATTAQTTPPAGAQPQSKGLLGAQPQQYVLADVLRSLMDEQNFRKSLDNLQADAEGIRVSARGLVERYEDFDRQLRREIGSGGPSGPDATLPSATLAAVARGFEELLEEIRSKIPRATTRKEEIEFDRITGMIDRRVADVKRLQTMIQGYQANDILAGLELDTNSLAAQLRVFQGNVTTVQTAVLMAKKMAQDAPDTAGDVNRQLLTADLKTLSGMSDADVKTLVDNYLKKVGDGKHAPFISSLPQMLDSTYEPVLREFAGGLRLDNDNIASLLRRLYAEARKLLFTDEVQYIDAVNTSEAAVFTEINAVYWRSRVLDDPRLVALDLGGKSGNLYVYYSISVTDNFTPYQFQSDISTPTLSSQITNSSNPPAPNAAGAGGTPQPHGTAGSPAVLAGGTPAPGGAGQNQNPAPAGPGPSTPAPAAPAPSGARKIYSNYVTVHHFSSGTVVAGFAFSTLPSYSFALAPRLDPSGNPVKDQGGSGDPQNIIVQTDYHRPQLQYVIGIDYYLFGKKDMFPDRNKSAKERWTPGVMIGTAMTELNHYFGGLDFEPALGFDICFGYHYGKKTVLQEGYVVDQIMPASVTSVPTRSVFRSGFFAMVGFDVNIFRSVFGKVTGVGGN